MWKTFFDLPYLSEKMDVNYFAIIQNPAVTGVGLLATSGLQLSDQINVVIQAGDLGDSRKSNF